MTMYDGGILIFKEVLGERDIFNVNRLRAIKAFNERLWKQFNKK